MRRQNRRQRLTVVVLLLACISLIALDYNGSLGWAHRAVGDVYGPVERGVDAAAEPVDDFFRGIPDVKDHQDQIDELERENAELKRQLETTGLDRARADELRRIRALSSDHGWDTHAARVIDLGPAIGFEWTARINAGSNGGVKEGMTVVAADGLVGRVKRVEATTSLVVLAADPGSSIGVRFIDSGEVGIASGQGHDPMSYVALDPGKPVKEGETVVTGPTGDTTYVPDIPVGKVSEVASGGSSATPRISIEPYVGYSSLDLVAVIMTLPRTDGDPE